MAISLSSLASGGGLPAGRGYQARIRNVESDTTYGDQLKFSCELVTEHDNAREGRKFNFWFGNSEKARPILATNLIAAKVERDAFSFEDNDRLAREVFEEVGGKVYEIDVVETTSRTNPDKVYTNYRIKRPVPLVASSESAFDRV